MGEVMGWTNWACAMAGCFVGSFAMTVWQNERRRRDDIERAERIKITASEREALIVASIELQALAMSETNHSNAIRELLGRAEENG